MKTLEDIKPFAALLEQEQRTEFAKTYPGAYLQERMDSACTVSVKMGNSFARVDLGAGDHCSGKYMVDLETGAIYGVKAYGVVHRGHYFGTLDTIHEWDWRGYRAVRRGACSKFVALINESGSYRGEYCCRCGKHESEHTAQPIARTLASAPIN